jgi:hypothetical protein
VGSVEEGFSCSLLAGSVHMNENERLLQKQHFNLPLVKFATKIISGKRSRFLPILKQCGKTTLRGKARLLPAFHVNLSHLPKIKKNHNSIGIRYSIITISNISIAK